MLSTKRLLLLVTLVAVVAWSPLSTARALGQDAEKAASPEKKPEKEQVDPFVVPDGTAAELVEYLESLNELRPSPQDRNAYIQFIVKSSKPSWKAADKILADATATKDQKVVAVKAKFGAVSILTRLRDREAAKAMEQMPKELSDLGLTRLARIAQSQWLSMELSMSAAGAPGAPPLSEVIKKIKDLVAEQPDRESFQLAYGVVSTLQRTDKTEKAAALCDEFSKIYSASDSPDLESLAQQFTAIARRLRLLGNSMKVEGTLLDGKSFDWSEYKGKVVLVQFWATWCGYCVEEIPSIRKCYDEYHDRGFDVVAISLDRSQAPLDKFLEKKPLPWPVLYKEGERNPTADYYGVTGLPTLILVDKDGKVVSLNARGPKLNEELEKLLGPPKEKAEATAETGA